MDKLKSPASGKRQGLINDFSESKSNIKRKIPKGIKHLCTPNDMANKWVENRYYTTLGRALQAVVAGDV